MAAADAAGRPAPAWRRRSPPARPRPRRASRHGRRRRRRPADRRTAPGAQSAVTMPRAMPGRSVTRASARGPSPAAQAAVACTTVGAVHLGQAEQGGGLGADGAGGAGAVLQHGVARVLAGQAAVQAGERAGGHAAEAGEEAMRRGQCRGEAGHRVGRAGPDGEQSGGESGRSGQAGWQSARALNRRPMRLGSARRWAASIRAAARCGGWPRARRPVRWNRPRRARNGPCGIGPCTAAPAARAVGGEGGEIHMGGEVGGAGRGERVGGPPAGDRLEGVARRCYAPARSRGTARRQGGR